MRRVVKIILIALFAGAGFSLNGLAQGINPESYREDYYKMPIQNEIQEKALLQFVLNSELPKITMDYPAVVTDADGNQAVYHRGKLAYSLAKDGTETYYLGGMPTHSEKVLESGERYRFREYRRVSADTLQVSNEFGDTVGWQTYGYDDRIVGRQDAYGKQIFALKYQNRRYWEHDLINNIWKKTKHGRVEEEYLGSPSGPLLARWVEGSFFGREGLWRIEKGWDGEKVDDLYYSFYGSTSSQDSVKYHRDGYILETKDYSKGLVREEALGNELSYRKYGDFGWVEEGRIYQGKYFREWAAEYDGSKIVKARRTYADTFYYDERIYDRNGNIDKVVRKDKTTDEVVAVLEDRIYFWEVEDMDTAELKSYFSISQDEAERLYNWLEGMKSKGKTEASLFGVYSPQKQKTLTLYEENNHPLYTISLLEYSA